MDDKRIPKGGQKTPSKKWTVNEETQLLQEYNNGKTIKYIIQKSFTFNYGIFNDLDDCIRERDLLIKCGWDWDSICEGIDETVDGESIFLNRKII